MKLDAGGMDGPRKKNWERISILRKLVKEKGEEEKEIGILYLQDECLKQTY
jgi:hypothetical protein